MKTIAKILTASALLATAAASTAQAQVVLVDDDRGPYVNVGVDTLGFDQYSLSGKLGYNMNEFFGFEGQAGVGISEEDDNIDGFEFGAGIDYFAGGFAVVRAPIAEQFDVFGRAGYYFAEVDADILDTASGLTTDVDADTDGFAFGAGAQFNFGPDNKNGIRAEYTYLDVQEVNDIDVDEFDLSGDLFSVSYVRKF